MNPRIFCYLAVASSLGGVALPAWAQDADSAPQAASRDFVSGDIVVTARRREEVISKVPVAITAFSGETLAAKQVDSVLDLTKLTPGLNFGGGGALTSSVVTIRGFSRALAGPGAPGVISYFNEVPLNNYGSNIPTYDMGNLQVLKGPQGTLFGRNAIGGAILSYSRKPTHDFNGYVEGEYGSFNTMRLEGAINLPVVQDKIALRIAGQVRDSDGFTKGYLYSPAQYQRGPDIQGIITAPGVALNDRPVDLDRSNTKSVRASLLVEPFAGLSSTTVVDYTRLSGVSGIDMISVNPATLPGLAPAARNFVNLGAFTAGQLLNPVWNCGTSPSCDINLALAFAKANPRTQYTDVQPYNVTKIFGITNTTSLDLGDSLTLKNIFGYRTLKIDNKTDLDGIGLNVLSAASMTNQKQITNELQLAGAVLDDKLQFVLGGFYYRTSPDGPGGDQALVTYALGGISVPYSINYLVAKSKALYGQVDYDASDLIQGLKFTAGYRQTWDDQDTCAYGASYGQPGQGGSTRVTPAAGVRPDFTPTFEQCKNNSFTPDPNAAPNSTVASNFHVKSRKGTYTFAINWQASDDILLYATARRGYRAGGINYPKVAAVIADIQTFAPEVLDDIELGAKGRFDIAGRPVNFSLAAYRGKVKGAQTFVNTQGLPAAIYAGSGLAINKNNYTIKGIEGLIQVEPVDGLSLGGNFAYIKATLDGFTIPESIETVYAANNISSALLGFAIYNQPKWQVNGNIEYVARDAVAGADFRMGADVHYQTRYAQNEFFVPGYTTVDARFGLTGLNDGKLDLTFWAKNLLNEYYYYGGSLTAASVGVLTYLQAPPRSVGATLRYRFGD